MSIDYTEIAKSYDDNRSYPESLIKDIIRLGNIKHGMKMLDIGCGTGNAACRLREIIDADVVGVDKSASMLEKAREKSLNVLCADVDKDRLPFADNYFDIIIGTYVYASLCNVNLEIHAFLAMIHDTSTLMSGTIEEINTYKFNYMDLTKNNMLYEKNIIPTNEGVVQIILNNIHSTIHGSTLLLLGFGRVGKPLAELLAALGAHVWIYAKNYRDIIENEHIRIAPKINDLSQYEIIINTVSAIILNKANLHTVQKNVLIIDIASFPGGMDTEYAKKNSIKVITTPGIPGKKAPLTAARNLKGVVKQYINRHGV